MEFPSRAELPPKSVLLPVLLAYTISTFAEIFNTSTLAWTEHSVCIFVRGGALREVKEIDGRSF